MIIYTYKTKKNLKPLQIYKSRYKNTNILQNYILIVKRDTI